MYGVYRVETLRQHSKIIGVYRVCRGFRHDGLHVKMIRFIALVGFTGFIGFIQVHSALSPSAS